MEYTYPIDVDWTQEDILKVVHFFNIIEAYYEKNSISREILMDAYKDFKSVVPGKADEKNIFETFKKRSGYDSYDVVKKAKDQRL
ncbi:UPF0223 family protein [Staphylococcus felis]|uniref:Uncharacterized protein n=1 Tax=Staphylococcus felis TaxID=46127 RepID=A0A3E0IR03_9STAP|nr:UPF0223 family protein [Staphylococcus felis]REH82350.1 hypothetical protein DOS61_09855 [Staphylococcus felis]REH89615.1 hypothetical protein DOS58_06275 [Staphylococcus felis]REH97861.1 hypothetical protein DOS83_04015 [Staphylococcus felis]UXR86089.1 UPF0223 family protein [Staphylococcus felis]